MKRFAPLTFPAVITFFFNDSQKHVMYMWDVTELSPAKLRSPCHSNPSVLFLPHAETHAGLWVPCSGCFPKHHGG